MREQILCHPCELREIPAADRNAIRVEATLFGWILWMNHEQVDCASEAEARYLAAFGRMGYTEIPVPKDAKILKAVTPAVEKAVADIIAQVEEKAAWELSRKRRSQLIDMVWEKLREKIDKAAPLPPSLAPS
jgi:hypothetical protein